MRITGFALAWFAAPFAILSSCDRPPRFVAEEIYVEQNGCAVKAMLNEPRGFMSAPRVYAVVECIGEHGDPQRASLFYTSGQAFSIDAAPSDTENEINVAITRCGHGYDTTPTDVAQDRLAPLRESLAQAGLNVSLRDGAFGCPMNFPSRENANWRSLD